MPRVIIDAYSELPISKGKRWKLRHPEAARASQRRTNVARRGAKLEWLRKNSERVKAYAAEYRNKHRDPIRRFDLHGPRPDWFKEAVSHRMKGRAKPPGFSEKISLRVRGDGNPSKRAEVREKLRAAALRQLADPLAKQAFVSRLPVLRGEQSPHYGKRHSLERRAAEAACKVGKYALERNPNWRGGLSFEPYTTEWTRQLKKTVIARDGECCRLCESSYRLHVHHVDSNKLNCAPANLITLCVICHMRAHKRPEVNLRVLEVVHAS